MVEPAMYELAMSYADAFGPVPETVTANSRRNAAVSWVRTSLFSRLKGNPHRSKVAVAVMYTAELSRPGVMPARRDKLEDARARLGRLDLCELDSILEAVRAAHAAAPNEDARRWAGFAEAALRDVRAQIVEDEQEPSPEKRARIARFDALVESGMSVDDAMREVGD